MPCALGVTFGDFRVSVGWRVRACGALTCAYVSGLDGHRPSVFLKVAVRDTGRGVSLVVCGLWCGRVCCWGLVALGFFGVVGEVGDDADQVVGGEVSVVVMVPSMGRHWSSPVGRNLVVQVVVRVVVTPVAVCW